MRRALTSLLSPSTSLSTFRSLHTPRRPFLVPEFAPAMPPNVAPPLPLNGLFPIEKPTGPTSMRVLDKLQDLMVDSKLFSDAEKIRHAQGTLHKKRKKNNVEHGFKVGQGGTLDPLADGVLVVGVNRGTKYLQKYLEGTKEYESIGILGAATTTMDAEGPVLLTGDFDKITREDLEKAIEKFQGEINQTPPIFSALKMEGKPLYEYARENKPLPRAIPVRKCTVQVKLVEFTPASREPGDGGHEYSWPEARLDEGEKAIFRRLTTLVHEQEAKTDQVESDFPSIPEKDWPETSATTGLRPPTFKVSMTVSGGTYVRSIVHDIGTALGCGAHVVQLRRTRQGMFVLNDDLPPLTDGERAEMQHGIDARLSGESTEEDEMNGNGDLEDETLKTGVPTGKSTSCIPWAVIEKAHEGRWAKIKEQESLSEEELMQLDPAVVQKLKTRQGRRELRMEGPLKEWEHEVLRRFISVAVPSSGQH